MVQGTNGDEKITDPPDALKPMQPPRDIDQYQQPITSITITITFMQPFYMKPTYIYIEYIYVYIYKAFIPQI